MTFTEAVRSSLSRYATFTGRARRAEYWWFYLFTVLVGIAASVVDGLLGLVFRNGPGVVGIVASLALLLPSIAVTVRRLHDTGRSGWWMLLPLVPALAALTCAVGMFFALFDSPGGTVSDAYVPEASGSAALLGLLAATFGMVALAGGITLVVFLCLDSTPGPNKYGALPKHPSPPTGPAGSYPPAGHGQPYPQLSPYGYSPQPPAPPSPGQQPPRA